MWAVVAVVVSVSVAVGGCWGAEGEPAVAKYMLRAEDVPGGGETTYPRRSSDFTMRCSEMIHLAHKNESQDEATPRATVRVEAEGGRATEETLVLSVYSPGTVEDVDRNIGWCAEASPFDEEQNGATEVFSRIPADRLPEGVVGYTATVTSSEDRSVVTYQRIFVRILRDGRYGIMMLGTAIPGDQPSPTTPMDLLDTALERAGAIIDSTALRIPDPLDPQTASPTPTPRATQTPSTEPPGVSGFSRTVGTRCSGGGIGWDYVESEVLG